MNNNQPLPSRGIPPQYQSSNNYSYNYDIPPKKSNTGLVVGIIFGIIFFVTIIAVTIFAFIVLSRPSGEDYEKAHNHIKEMAADYRVLSNSPDDSMALENFEKGAEELGKMRAVTKDEDIKALYDKFYEKLPKFIRTLKSESVSEARAVIHSEFRNLGLVIADRYLASTL